MQGDSPSRQDLETPPPRSRSAQRCGKRQPTLRSDPGSAATMQGDLRVKTSNSHHLDPLCKGSHAISPPFEGGRQRSAPAIPERSDEGIGRHTKTKADHARQSPWLASSPVPLQRGTDSMTDHHHDDPALPLATRSHASVPFRGEPCFSPPFKGDGRGAQRRCRGIPQRAKTSKHPHHLDPGSAATMQGDRQAHEDPG